MKNRIEDIYRNYAENTAPDMDALWQRIESGLEEKDSSVTSKPIRRKISMTKTIAAAAACVAVIVAIPIAMRNNSADMAASEASTQAGEMLDGAAADDAMDAGAMPEYEENDMAASDEYFEEAAEEDFAEAMPAEDNFAAAAPQHEAVLYENLALEYAEIPTDAPYAETIGDDFFVEENVLIETDIIVSAYIDMVCSDGNGSMVYVVTADNLETGKTGSICFTSATPYVMLEGRCYILPMKTDGEVYSLAFENSPQIERTLDGGYIFHNGWKCLNENAFDVIYPQGEIDDFFYDRMKFSYGDIGSLVEKWLEIKG